MANTHISYRYFISLLMVISLSGCFSDEEELNVTPRETPKALFEQAKDQAGYGESEQAIELFKTLQLTYPTSKYAIQAKIEVPYILYKSEEYDKAIAALNNFIKLYPNHEGTSYAYYLRGVISETKSKSILDDYLTDKAQRDIRSARQAYDYFVELIELFPTSKYAAEAKTKLVILRNVLARHELYVARFYSERKAYIAAINRAKYIIENYPESPSIPAALVLLERNYTAINALELAKDAKRILDKNYPTYQPHFE